MALGPANTIRAWRGRPKRGATVILAMPELVEIEIYRRTAERVVGRRIVGVTANDAWFCKRATTPELLCAVLPGLVVNKARRHGKLLLLDFADHCDKALVLGLRFGMTGRLVVDGSSDIDELLYSSGRDNEAWDRFSLTFDDGGSLSVRDPRRLGGVELDPESAPTFHLGPDARTLTIAQLRLALGGARGPVKAALLDQSRIAGIGNLIVDEVLWRASISPSRSVPSLSDNEVTLLARTISKTVALLLKRGGSHLGDLVSQRHHHGRCPRDGRALVRSTVGGRTTYACVFHQT